jgi:hypothetical protein
MLYHLEASIPGTNKIHKVELERALEKLEVGDELICPWDTTTATNVLGLARRLGYSLHTQHPKGDKNLLVYRSSNPTSLSKDVLGEHYVFFAPKTRQLIPLRLFKALRKSDLEKEVTKGHLVKSSDFPGIKHGFYHDKIYTWAGNVDLGELKRLDTLWRSLYE